MNSHDRFRGEVARTVPGWSVGKRCAGELDAAVGCISLGDVDRRVFWVARLPKSD